MSVNILNVKQVRDFLSKTTKFTKNAPIPAFESVFFEGDRMVVSSESGYYSKKIDGMSYSNGYMDGKDMRKLFSNIKTSTVEFSANDGKIEIVSDKAKFKFSCKSKMDRLVPGGSNWGRVGLITHEMIGFIKKAVNFTAKDELRPIMNHVLVDDKCVVASDSHKMYRKEIKGDRDVVEDMKFMINKTVIAAMGNEEYNMLTDGDYMMASGDTEDFIWKVEGNYPNYNAVWPTNYESSFEVIRKKLQESLQYALLQCNKASGMVRFYKSDHNLVIKSEDIDFDKSFESNLSCKNIGNDVSIGIKGEFILYSIDLHKSESSWSRVKIEHSDNTKCVIVNDTVLIMPIMLNN